MVALTIEVDVSPQASLIRGYRNHDSQIEKVASIKRSPKLFSIVVIPISVATLPQSGFGNAGPESPCLFSFG